MIQVNGLTKRFGPVTALDHLSLAVPDGAVFGLVGPNGSGKSTLFKLLMQFIFPDSGSTDLGGLAPSSIGYMSDRPFLPTRFRALEYLLAIGRLTGLRGTDAQTAAQDALAQVGLRQSAGMRIGALSKGMAQRLALAAALLSDSPLLLLDEPLGGLDPAQQASMRELVHSLHRQGRTILLSSHLLTEVSGLCTHLGILKRGRLIRTGSLEELLLLRPQVAICVDRLSPELAAALVQAVPGLEINGETILLRDESITWKNRILGMLVEAGCDIEELRQERATLEEIYLEAMRQ